MNKIIATTLLLLSGCALRDVDRRSPQPEINGQPPIHRYEDTDYLILVYRK